MLLYATNGVTAKPIKSLLMTPTINFYIIYGKKKHRDKFI